MDEYIEQLNRKKEMYRKNTLEIERLEEEIDHTEDELSYVKELIDDPMQMK